jgi:hypothetical protein
MAVRQHMLPHLLIKTATITRSEYVMNKLKTGKQVILLAQNVKIDHKYHGYALNVIKTTFFKKTMV